MGVHCPKCGSSLSFVRETRQRKDTILRRRQCFKCDAHFKTVETVETGRESAA